MRLPGRSMHTGLARDPSRRQAATPAGHGSWHWLDGWCLDQIAAALPGAPVLVRLWDGTSRALAADAPVAAVTIHDRATLLRLVAHPTLEFGEAYTHGRLDVQGDLTTLFDATNRAMGRSARRRSSLARWSHRVVGASLAAARRNIRRHYDLGNDFYRLWLDDAMIYTCAYFEDPAATLEAAQQAKLDYVCRKLRLQPGERVVEAGSGWGALAIHMARHYGVHVRAYNISAAQLAYARERAAAAGVADRVTFVDADYRSIDGTADVFVSVGMLEHVGPRRYDELGAVMGRVLDPDRGRGLLHFIGRPTPMPFNAWTTRHVFPGAYAPTLGEIAAPLFERHGLAMLDVEDLRLHYAATLAQWQQRFEAQADRVSAMFDEHFVRLWRMYLATARAGFLSGDLQLFQITFGRARCNETPMTRRALYA